MNHRLLKRLVGAGAVIVSGAMLLGTTTAGANTFSPPLGQSPGWYTPTAVNISRAGGSETSFYLMQKLGDLYTQTMIYGCALLSTDNRTCDPTQDNSTTASSDNYSRTEFDNGLANGSGTGLKYLCDKGGGSGLATLPPINFARASRAANTDGSESGAACPGTASPVTINGHTYSAPVDLAYADDAVPALAFPFTGQSAITGVTGGATQIGPVANGWTPVDPLNCGTGGAAPACTNNPLGTANKSTGVPALDVSNFALETGTGASTSSVAFRLFCTTTTGNADPLQNKIVDWGQLTDPTSSGNTLSYTDKNGAPQTITLTKGQEGVGTPIGVPIYLPKVNTNSGTEQTFKTFACGATAANATLNTNSDPNNLMQENDAPQLADIGGTGGAGTATYLAGRSPGGTPTAFFPTAAPVNDPVYQSNLVAASIYYISNGVSLWQPFTKTGGRVSGAPQGRITTENFIPGGGTNEQPSCQLPTCNPIPTKRQLHNSVNPNALTASTLGFLNWICSSDFNLPPTGAHGVDATTGKDYGVEINANISTVFNFPREDCTTASTVLVPTNKTESATTGTASPVVSDTSIHPSDAGALVTGSGIPANATVGSVMDGVGFTILVNGTPTNDTLDATATTLTLDFSKE